MAMKLTFTNIMKFFSYIAPLLLGTCLVLISFFNSDAKGIVYLAGALLTAAFNLLIMNFFKSPASPERAPSCNLVDFGPTINEYDSPAFNSTFISYTFMYLVMPMIASKQISPSLIVFLLIIFFTDAITKLKDKCTKMTGIIFGGLLGLVAGAGWYILFHSLGYDKLLYFNNAAVGDSVCTRPSKQTFKCSVYKNGEVIANL